MTLTEQLQQANNSSEIRATLFAYMKEKGQSKYDESVTQYEHAVQTAHHAVRTNSSDELVVAALFHDIGHMLADEDQSQLDFLTTDRFHEEVAAKYLIDLFSASRPRSHSPPCAGQAIHLHARASVL